MSTHNIGFYEENYKQNYHLIIIKYPQIRTLFLLLRKYKYTLVRNFPRIYLMCAQKDICGKCFEYCTCTCAGQLSEIPRTGFLTTNLKLRGAVFCISHTI